MMEHLVSYYRSGDAIRSRSVGAIIRSDHCVVPAPPARLLADWQRDTTERLGLEPGDVEALSLPRARMRWPGYRQCVQAVADWTRSLGLQHDVLARSEVALMACRGANYHHDAAHYGGAAFCNLFLGEDQGLDVHFPLAGLRIPLVRGTVMLFDTAQPHAVIGRHRSGFDAADFSVAQECTQVFLTWELPIEEKSVATALAISFDVAPLPATLPDAEQVWYNGAPARVCLESGRWLRA